VGNRRQFPLDARWLLTLVPWVQSADIYVCGPPDLNRSVLESARVLGVPPDRVHSEAFSF
jgi:ferredoxin-NADP reductase